MTWTLSYQKGFINTTKDNNGFVLNDNIVVAAVFTNTATGEIRKIPVASNTLTETELNLLTAKRLANLNRAAAAINLLPVGPVDVTTLPTITDPIAPDQDAIDAQAALNDLAQKAAVLNILKVGATADDADVIAAQAAFDTAKSAWSAATAKAARVSLSK